MAYIPFAQRKKQEEEEKKQSGGYVPVAKRVQPKPILSESLPKAKAPSQPTFAPGTENIPWYNRPINTQSLLGKFQKFIQPDNTLTRFITELPAAGAKIQQGTFRLLGGAVNTIADSELGKASDGGRTQDIKVTDIDPNSSRLTQEIQRGLYGDEPLGTSETEGKQFLESIGLGRFSNNKQVNSSLGLGMGLLEVTGLGKTDDAISAIVKSKSPQTIKQILKDIGLIDELAETAAPKLAKMTDEIKVRQAIESMAETQQSSRAIPKAADNLITEAKNYESPAKFASARQPVFRGGEAFDPKLIKEDGVSLTTERSIAETHKSGKIKGQVDELYLEPDTKLLKVADEGKALSHADKQKFIYEAQNKGFDGVDFTSLGEKEIRVFNADKIKTKLELDKAWAEANLPPLPTAMSKAKTTLAQKIELAETNLAKLGFQKENLGAAFDSASMESQYQKFKKFITPKKLDEIEDSASFKSKVKADPEEIDNMLYSQEHTGDEVFDMFKERRFRELEERGMKGQLTAEEVMTKRSLVKLERENRIRTDKKIAMERIKASYENKISKIKTAKGILDNRRSFIRAVQRQFELSDADIKAITKRDIRLMSNVEFKTFLDDLAKQSETLAKRRFAGNVVQDTIQRLELKKVENLQKAMELPPIPRMTETQLTEFNKALEQFKVGDEFLSVRKLETVDNTDLKGIKTLREARERLAKELNVDISELDNIKVAMLDRYRYDTALAEKNPFYGLLVDSVNKSVLNAEARYLDVEEKINELINAARSSRAPKGLKDRIVSKFVPQDTQIFKWLESSDQVKKTLELTDQELEAAQYIQKQYANMRDYLVQFGTLKKYREDYITHIRRGFLEEWKETGILKAMKTVFQQYKQDEAIFNIIDDTGQILPLEKFFQFSMKRSGEVAPTENVANAFLSYLKAFEKKAALDSVVPKLDIYAHSLTPKVMTPRGLEFDRSLKTFVNEWINTKKGRTAKIVGVEQGGKIDLLLRAGKSFTAMLDLGVNIPVGLSARAGENMTNFIQMGVRNYAKGLARARTAQGQKIAETYKNFIGRTPFSELFDARKGLAEKVFDSAFGLFQDATVRSNKTYLLGSLTDAELKSGIIHPERLAQLKRDMGRYRVVEGAKSVVGSTSVGGVLTQYKSWAIPIVRTTLDNINKIRKNPALIKSREGQELFRGAMAALSVMFVMKAFVGDDKDDSFIGTLINKAYRDSMSLVGALDPQTMTSEPRLVKFIGDLGESLGLIYKLEGSKAIDKTQQTTTPRIIKQFQPNDKKSSKKKNGDFPDLPDLPKLPKFPKID